MNISQDLGAFLLSGFFEVLDLFSEIISFDLHLPGSFHRRVWLEQLDRFDQKPFDEGKIVGLAIQPTRQGQAGLGRGQEFIPARVGAFGRRVL